MPEYGITPEGFKRKRLDTILEELNDDFKVAFGENWDTDPQSPQGQLVGSIAESWADLWEMSELAFNSFNPSAATDAALSSLVQLNHIERLPATATSVDLVLGGDPGTVIPVGSLVSIEDGPQFTTLAEVTLDGVGSATVSADAVELGPINAEAGTISVIDTPVTGWDSVTNPEAGLVGQNRESDSELRARRERSTAIESFNLWESLLAGLLDTEDVQEVSVLENDTDFVDSRGLPPHSFECVVLGGDPQDIIQVIWKRHPFGITSHGDETYEVLDSQGFPHDIRLTRPENIDIFIDIDLNVNSNYPVDGDDQIKQSILDYANGDLVEGVSIGIGQLVRYSRMYTPINSVRGHFVNSLFIGTSASPTGTSNIPIAYNQRARFTLANINITHSGG